MSEEQLNSALNLMRRMPPSSVENSLAGLIELVPDLTDDLLNHVDQPLKVKKDNAKNQDFIMCDYNRDGDSFRSEARTDHSTQRSVTVAARRSCVAFLIVCWLCACRCRVQIPLVQRVFPSHGRWLRSRRSSSRDGDRGQQNLRHVRQSVLRLARHHVRLLLRHGGEG